MPMRLHACGADGTSTQWPSRVELETVIGAANAVLLVAAEKQRGAAVRAELVDQSGLALGVAEREELLAQDLHTHLRAVRLGDLAATAGPAPSSGA